MTKASHPNPNDEPMEEGVSLKKPGLRIAGQLFLGRPAMLTSLKR